MKDPMNTSGIWPAVRPADVTRVDFVHRRRLPPESPFDFAEGIPERVDSIPTATLMVAVFLMGVVVAAVGIGVANGALTWWSGVLYVVGVVAGFTLRIMVEPR